MFEDGSAETQSSFKFQTLTKPNDVDSWTERKHGVVTP